VIGITVITPFALFALTRRRVLPMTTETLLQFIAICLALALVFGFTQEQQFQLFYVLFLPIVWLAVRTGSEGVSVGILVTQLGLILGIQLFPAGTFDVTAFQALMLVLAMTGLVAGELVQNGGVPKPNCDCSRTRSRVLRGLAVWANLRRRWRMSSISP